MDRSLTPNLDLATPIAARVSIPFAVVAYADPAQAADPTLELELYRDGQLRTRSPVPAPARDAKGQVRFSGSINAAQLRSGAYRVRIVARQGEATTASETSFTVTDDPAAVAESPVSVPARAVQLGSEAGAPVAAQGRLGPEATAAMNKAVGALRLGRYDETIKVLKALDKRTPGGCHDECLLALATAYFLSGAHKDVEATLQPILTTHDDAAVRARAWELVGRSLLFGLPAQKQPDARTRARLESALAAFGRALELTAVAARSLSANSWPSC